MCRLIVRPVLRTFQDLVLLKDKALLTADLVQPDRVAHAPAVQAAAVPLVAASAAVLQVGICQTCG